MAARRGRGGRGRGNAENFGDERDAEIQALRRQVEDLTIRLERREARSERSSGNGYSSDDLEYEDPFAPLILSKDGHFDSCICINGDSLEFPYDDMETGLYDGPPIFDEELKVIQTDFYDGPPIFDEELEVISEEQIFKNDTISIVLSSGISFPVDDHATNTYSIDGQHQVVICYDDVSMDVGHILLDQPWQYDRATIHDGIGRVKIVLLPYEDISYTKSSKQENGSCLLILPQFRRDVRAFKFGTYHKFKEKIIRTRGVHVGRDPNSETSSFRQGGNDVCQIRRICQLDHPSMYRS